MHASAAFGVLLLTVLTGCATVKNRPPRLAYSSYGCMAEVVRQKVPTNLPDKRTHCLAAGLITRYCSQAEAYIAGVGKEVRDLLGHGDVEWGDWRADRAGVSCALRAENDETLAACCGEVEQR